MVYEFKNLVKINVGYTPSFHRFEVKMPGYELLIFIEHLPDVLLLVVCVADLFLVQISEFLLLRTVHHLTLEAQHHVLHFPHEHLAAPAEPAHDVITDLLLELLLTARRALFELRQQRYERHALEVLEIVAAAHDAQQRALLLRQLLENIEIVVFLVVFVENLALPLVLNFSD